MALYDEPMPQMGLHMCVGLAMGRSMGPKDYGFRLGLLAGSVFPDLDFIPLIPLRFVDRELAVSMHRNFTHSVLGAVVLSIVVAIVAVLTRTVSAGRLAAGMGLAMLVHATLDVFMWFSGVNLSWPWGEKYGPFQDLAIPDWLGNLTLAADAPAYILVLYYARYICGSPPRGFRAVVGVLTAGTVVLLPLAFAMPSLQYEMVAYGFNITCGFLPVVVMLFRSRRALLTPPDSPPGGPIPTA